MGSSSYKMLLNDGNTFFKIKLSVECKLSFTRLSSKKKVIISQNIFKQLNLISGFSLLLSNLLLNMRKHIRQNLGKK